jgi:hypothetical protein
MFTVKGSNGNDCGDDNDGKENNDGCDAMATTARA